MNGDTRTAFALPKHFRHGPEVDESYRPRIELDSINGVHLLTWPRDRELRERLARSCAPRIVLAAPHDLLDSRDSTDEAWVPLTSTYEELVETAARVVRGVQAFERSQPWVDEYGVVHRGPVGVALTRSEAIVLRELLRFEGQVVPRVRLQQLLDASKLPSNRALEGIMYRLRLRLTELRLVVRAARSQGFVVDVLGRAELAS